MIISLMQQEQKVSRLCLLDLSAPFDTIHHNNLITRLSFLFGIHVSVLNCRVQVLFIISLFPRQMWK